MPEFRFRALDAGGKRVEGVLEGENADQVVQRVQQMGHLPLSVAPAAGGFDLGFLKGRKAGLSGSDSNLLTRELATLLLAGQDIDRALRFIAETASSLRIRAVAGDLRDKVRGGRGLASALAEHPKSFSRLYIGLVRAGEESGTLGQALSELADLLERQRKLTTTIRTALIYPALLAVMTVASVAFLLVFVLPQFTPIFKEAGANLPELTRFVIAMGDLLRDHGAALLLAALAAVLAVGRAWRDRAWRRRIERAFLRLPVAGTLIRQGQAARFTRTLGTLLGNGVGLVGALAIAREVVTSTLAAEAITHAAARVKEGSDLAHPLAEFDVFPAQSLHLLQLGAETGKLASMCLKVADLLDDQIRVTVQTLVSLLVPAVTIIMGVAVAGIIASLLLAMLSLNDLPL